MRYKNVKTGAVFSSPCIVKGGDWVNVADAPKEPVKEVKTGEQITKMQGEESETEDELPEITKKQIMQELDAFDIEYDSKAKKKELYDLMMAQGR